MPKITLTDLVNNYASISQLNDNFDKIETELNDNVLYRNPPSGEPNQMEDNLDLNSNRIINIGKPIGETDAVRLKDVQDIANNITTASFVTYDNSTSALNADDVQAAIDELEQEIDAVAIGEIDAENVNIEDSGGFYSSVNAEGAFTEIALDLQQHTTNTSNPHSVNKNQVGLANVQNVDTTDAANVDITDSGGNYTATDVEAALAEEADARQAHEADTNDPHDVQASQVDYSNTSSGLTAAQLQAAVDEIVSRTGNSGSISGSRNAIINGGFDVWQRGTSFTDPVGSYTADRWIGRVLDGAGTVSRQEFPLGQTDVPGEPKYFARHNRTTATTGSSQPFEQRIEEVRTFAGQMVAVSFYAKIDNGKSLNVDIVQDFGTGGSPSSSVVTDVGDFTGDGTWQKHTFSVSIPSISGKTIGTNGDDHLRLRLEEDANFSTFTLDIANVQLEKGTIATPFERRPIGEELALAQRYYVGETKIAFNAGHSSTVAGEVGGFVAFPVEMRASPTITQTTTSTSNVSSTADQQQLSEKGVEPFRTVNATGPVSWTGTYEADAEL